METLPQSLDPERLASMSCECQLELCPECNQFPCVCEKPPWVKITLADGKAGEIKNSPRSKREPALPRRAAGPEQFLPEDAVFLGLFR